MDMTNGEVPKKGHMKSFWPLMIIFVVAVILAGFVYWFQFSLTTDYDLQSMVLTIHTRGSAPKDSKTVSKTKAPATTNSTSTQK